MIFVNKLKGSILPITIIFAIVGIGLVFAYFKWVSHKRYKLNYRIAETKALYNAETGLAEKVYRNLVKADLFADSESNYVVLEGEEIENMGFYRDVELGIKTDSLTYRDLRYGSVEGVAIIHTLDGQTKEITRTVEMAFSRESLAEYMYLTDDEQAGGAPFVYDGSGSERRDVTFGAGDDLGGGNIQSNGTMVLSTYYPPPVFTSTVYITYGQTIELNGHNFNSVFQGNPDTLSRPKVKLPPVGYRELINASDYTYDAKRLLKYGSGAASRDTLIMTDIEFIESGEFRVKQWWYLKPPHLKWNYDYTANPLPRPRDLEACTLNGADLRECPSYEDSLQSYHAKWVDNSGNDQFMESTICGPHGFAHCDFEPINKHTGQPDQDALLLDETRHTNRPVVIYVKGGQVRVHGTFKGRYTIVTDEFMTYRRHGWPGGFYGPPPVDTTWCNIWLTDNLKNADAIGNTVPQPQQRCEGGSDNIMGLVSGANVIIANTWANGARDSYGSNQDIVIHADLCAFNESFVIQYWQNTSNFYDPPHGDGRGPSIFGGYTNQSDIRGNIILWGGVVQRYRGFMERNLPGPYDIFPGIGMDKDYHYDRNLSCAPPPHFPSIEYEGTNEISLKLSDYGEKK
ncbi:MAG: hypothetical protein ISR90_02315 [Candidatus Marinimicrobia bacterium]|nr:hypothetical protein [Candidatus Neomarinimicrobiota bacterium]MBL7022877.1 hypothetical protein [Candidatus Neomarinimicrobiota bacterium]MBL7109196.1 hypothetical protein [Candidatus Neomarinimicrobiota bacterium]